MFYRLISAQTAACKVKTSICVTFPRCYHILLLCNCVYSKRKVFIREISYQRVPRFAISWDSGKGNKYHMQNPPAVCSNIENVKLRSRGMACYLHKKF